MFDLSQGRGWALLVLCGAACLAFALLGTMGAAFSSTGFAFAAFVLVDVPLCLGLIGSRLPEIKFPALSIFGSSVVLIGILSIYAKDIKSGLTSTSFFFERAGWFLFGFNAIHIFLAATKIKQLRNRTGAPSWPQ
jgi:hypothetical protein